jgi:hydroxyacylglutathione hydrolase
MKTWLTKNGYKITQILSGRSNVFLLTNGEKNMLVDTSPACCRGKLEKSLKASGVQHIDYLMLTHTHFDHAGNAHRIKEKYGAKVMVHKTETSFLEKGDNILPQGTNLLSRTIMRIMKKPFIKRFGYETCTYDYAVDSVFDLNDFGFDAYILHTPGHTPGSMSLIIDNEIALVGDALFGIFRNSAFPPFANDVEQMVASWGKLLDTGCSLFIPSHGTADSRELLEREYRKRMK